MFSVIVVVGDTVVNKKDKVLVFKELNFSVWGGGWGVKWEIYLLMLVYFHYVRDVFIIVFGIE